MLIISVYAMLLSFSILRKIIQEILSVTFAENHANTSSPKAILMCQLSVLSFQELSAFTTQSSGLNIELRARELLHLTSGFQSVALIQFSML